MNKKIYFLGILFLIAVFVSSSGQLMAQKSISAQGDEAFDAERYNDAIELYKKAITKIKNKAEKGRVLFRLAECFRETQNNKQAINWYTRVIKSNYPDPIAYLYLANAQKSEELYTDAIVSYNEFKKLAPNDPRGALGAEACQLAIKWKEEPTRYVVENVKKLNSKAMDFAPYFADKNYKALLFTSNRDGSTGSNTDGWTGQNFSDIFITTLDKKGAWSEPLPADENLNTNANEGSPWLNKKANVIYFTRCPKIKNTTVGCQIYFSKKQGRGWAPPDTLKLGGNLSTDTKHPTLDDDELTIYFASDMKGGFGGKDIWMAKRTKKTKPFDTPVNLGAGINTSGDEMYPYLRDDGVLYFSSNGFENLGMGGLDIFKTSFENGKWTKPENMKYPINSAGDDFGIIFKGTKEEGFLSSNRKGGKGSDDLYSFILPPLVFTLQGVVRDDSTKQVIPDALVVLKGSDGTTTEVKTDATGFYQFGKSQILENTTYDLNVTKTNYFGDNGRETTINLKASTDLVHNFNLPPVPKVPVVLPDVLYPVGQWYLTEQAKDSLNWLVDVLKKNPAWVIELSSHTDNRPIKMTNDSLSQRRARSAVNFIVDSNGINGLRIIPKGYGSNRPRVLDRDKNVTLDAAKYPQCKGQSFFFAKGTQMTDAYIKSLKSNCEKEAAHQLNRRTEFTILREDFVAPVTYDTNAQNMVVQINPNDNIVPILPMGGGTFEGRCIVNNISSDFKYDAAEETMTISSYIALKLLKEYRITVSDFKDKAQAFNEDGSIKENSVVILKKVNIGTKTITNVEAVVVSKLTPDIYLGSKVLSKFGEYSIDEDKKQLIFDNK